MNELPENALIKIFEFVNLEDLVSVGNVCQRFSWIREHKLAITELVVSTRIEPYKSFWSFSDQPIYYENAIRLDELTELMEPLQIKQNLKCLQLRDFVGDYSLRFDCSILTEFVQLQQLELECVLNGKQTICSQSLNMMSTMVQNQLVLDTPNLMAFKCRHLREVRFVYPEILKVLKANDFERSTLSKFTNLECLELLNGGALDPEILTMFEQLKELVIHLGTTEKYARFKGTMANIFKQKLVLRRLDFKVFIHGFEVSGMNKFVERFDRERPVLFLIDNYLENSDLLFRNLSAYTAFNYTELWSFFKWRIPDDFTVQFFNIRQVNTLGKIQDEEHFIGFLKSLILESLHLKHSVPSQAFLVQLSACKQLIKLKIEENIDLGLNYEFLLSIRLLEEFSTDQYCPDLMRLASRAFQMRKYLKMFESTNAMFKFRAGFVPNSNGEYAIDLNWKSRDPSRNDNRVFWQKLEIGDLIRSTIVLGDLVNKEESSQKFISTFNLRFK